MGNADAACPDTVSTLRHVSFADVPAGIVERRFWKSLAHGLRSWPFTVLGEETG